MAEKNLTRCVIVAGSPSCDYLFVKETVTESDFVICADKGYEFAKKAEILPDLIIGDFDSFNGSFPATEIIPLNIHKDDTDTEHCVKEAINRGFKNIIILGALGGRTDHSYANLCILKYLNEKGANGIIMNRDETVEYKSKGVYKYDNVKGKTFSVFPFGCNKAVVSYFGECEYPARNLTLKSTVAMGISNIFKDNSVKIEVISGNVLVFVENI